MVEEIREEDSEDLAKIKVFSSDDEKLKVLGELLSNKSSRDIIRSLVDKEMYANEIAKKLDLPRNLVIHHLRKMESIGLLEITSKKIIRKGEEHRFFKIPQNVLIVPNESSERVHEGIRTIFKQGIKFVAIGAAGFVTWMSDIANYGKTQEVYPVPFGEGVHTDPLIPALIIIVIGLAIERAVSTLRKKKKGLS